MVSVLVLTINNVERESSKFLMAQKEAQPTETELGGDQVVPTEEAICAYRSPFRLLF